MTETPRPRRFTVHALSLKLALFVAGFLLVPAILVFWMYDLGPLGNLAVLCVSGGGAAYLVACRLLRMRLELAQSTLIEIRKRQFENLEAAHTTQGDELNALIWQVYRTGRAVENEIRELRRLENYRREFLGNVSHELKTPIFSIRGFAETLLDGALEDDRVNQAFVEKILRNADRLANLARDLGEVARLEMGELKMKPVSFSLDALVQEVIESLEPAASDKEITLHFQIPSDLPDVFGDREHIRQVIVNLVDNAIKYNNVGGHVEVVARLLASEEVKISVVDDGIGIAPEHIPRLTERFYRVDTSRSRSQGGTGLGLAIVKHMLGAHNSRLMVKSNPGRGSTFGFTLTIHEKQLDEQEQQVEV